MEYLVTYGWALLALLVVLVALVSSGIFSASHFIFEECNFQPNLACSPYILYSSETASTLQFSVRNGLGFPIKFTNVNVSFASGQTPQAAVTAPASIVQDGEKYDVKINFASPLPRGSQQTLYVQLFYVNCMSASAADCSGTSGEYTTSGRVVANVQQAS
ncbi:Uncharacterised protein [Candidatus Anstonella stagnisolia]|nr:Uncharacterised protein [Candidatus Anstonella stagnisolia]